MIFSTNSLDNEMITTSHGKPRPDFMIIDWPLDLDQRDFVLSTMQRDVQMILTHRWSFDVWRNTRMSTRRREVNRDSVIDDVKMCHCHGIGKPI